ncbi:MAG: hypothetical protein QOF97_1742 [Acidimicrobiaceae bacterium]
MWVGGIARHADVVTDPTAFRLDRSATRAVLAVDGPLDNLSSPPFEQLISRCLAVPDPVNELVIDLTDSPFVTAAGFRTLLQEMNRATEAGCTFRVAHERPLVRSTMSVLGLESVLG